MTFLRFTEHHESPGFKGKIFSLEEYIAWYTATSPGGMATGRFTYYEDWEGFTLPSAALKLFYEGKFPDLTANEKQLLNIFNGVSDGLKGRRFCIIGTYDGDQGDVMQHEIAHALWNMNKEYRMAARGILRGINPAVKAEIRNLYFLKSAGYNPSCWLDETQAYIIDSLDDLAKEGVNTKHLSSARTQLSRLFDNHFKIQKEI
jgi:hypothetical protein